ncbi:MAG: flagellin [Peptostreptococcaceae bacterium]|nr:flagellin [Peptostreptococcaceae bacterium]
MRINHNIAALNTYSRLNSASNAQAKSLEKLSSGLRINRAGDDAAGLAISEKMRGQISGLNQASRNAQDGISMIQTAEGALNETHSMLQRIRELAVQSNNDTNTSDDIVEIQKEIKALTDQIDSIASDTEFNGKKLLNGTLALKLKVDDPDLFPEEAGTAVGSVGILVDADVDVSAAKASAIYTFTYGLAAEEISLSNGEGLSQTVGIGTLGAVAEGDVLNFDKLGVKITIGATASVAGLDGQTLITEDDAAVSGSANLQIGANAGQELRLSFSDMSADALGMSAGATFALSGVDVSSDINTFTDTLGVIDQAISDVSSSRSTLGAGQNRLEHSINNLTTSAENLTAAESRVRDVDMAKEMMEFTKNNILSQAATSMLAQANQQPQSVLQLLR